MNINEDTRRDKYMYAYVIKNDDYTHYSNDDLNESLKIGRCVFIN